MFFTLINEQSVYFLAGYAHENQVKRRISFSYMVMKSKSKILRLPRGGFPNITENVSLFWVPKSENNYFGFSIKQSVLCK